MRAATTAGVTCGMGCPQQTSQLLLLLLSIVAPAPLLCPHSLPLPVNLP